MATTTTRPTAAHQLQVHPQHGHHGGGGGYLDAAKGNLFPNRERGSHGGPSATQVLTIVTLLPVCGTLLGLAGLTMIGTMVGLAVATPLFLLFSPVIVPAVIAIGLAVTGFLTSGALGLSGLSSLSWLMEYWRQGRSMPEQMEYAKRRMQDAVVTLGQKTKDVGQTIQNTAQDNDTNVAGKDQAAGTRKASS